MDPFDHYYRRPRPSPDAINDATWWIAPKILCVVFAIALILLGLFPQYTHSTATMVALSLLTIVMQIAIGVPLIRIIIHHNKTLTRS